jgi:hypothetical protein
MKSKRTNNKPAKRYLERKLEEKTLKMSITLMQ